MASPASLVNKQGRRTLFMSVKNLFTICCASAGWIEMGVETELKMLMYHVYIPLFRSKTSSKCSCTTCTFRFFARFRLVSP